MIPLSPQTEAAKNPVKAGHSHHKIKTAGAAYGKDLKQQKITFPKVTDPVPLLYQLNAAETDVFQNTLIRSTAGAFNYARYKPLDPLYYTKPVEEAAVQGQRNLAGFMKILLVKRLESGFFAFQETLKRFIHSHAHQG